TLRLHVPDAPTTNGRDLRTRVEINRHRRSRIAATDNTRQLVRSGGEPARIGESGPSPAPSHPLPDDVPHSPCASRARRSPSAPSSQTRIELDRQARPTRGSAGSRGQTRSLARAIQGTAADPD